MKFTWTATTLKPSSFVGFLTKQTGFTTQDVISAACFAADLINAVKTTYGRAPFHCPLNEDIVATDDKLNQLSALEEVTMVGYPQSLCDEAHGLPIFRKGYTASHPAIDFNGEPIGLMDIAGLWGSSGSPIFIYKQNGYSDRLGNTYLGTGRTIFLGIQYAIPTYTAEGKIEVKVIPTDMTPVPMVKNAAADESRILYQGERDPLVQRLHKEPGTRLIIQYEITASSSSSSLIIKFACIFSKRTPSFRPH